MNIFIERLYESLSTIYADCPCCGEGSFDWSPNAAARLAPFWRPRSVRLRSVIVASVDDAERSLGGRASSLWRRTKKDMLAAFRRNVDEYDWMPEAI